MLTPSCWNRWRTQPLDGSEDTTEQSATDSHLRELERDGAGMADNPRTDFDQPGLGAEVTCRVLLHAASGAQALE